MLEEIRTKLFELQDTKYQEFQSKLIPNISNIIGVRVPLLRKLAKSERERGLSYLKYDKKYYEEILLEALFIQTLELTREELSKYLDSYVKKIDNWALCDLACYKFKLFKEDPEWGWNLIIKYKESQQEYAVRFFIVMLFHFIDIYPFDKILKEIKSIDKNTYYVKMAISWLLSMMYLKERETILSYLTENEIDIFIYNKTLQKIIESNQVLPDEKDKIRLLKRKTT